MLMLGALIGAGANLLGGLLGANSAKKNAAAQMAMQKEFAQNGIQWKVQDAQKAGIHPLAALGANTISYSPVSVGDGGLSSSISAAGQDIGRAVDATKSESGRIGSFANTMQKLQLQRAGLENQLLQSQIANLRQAGHPPAFPSYNDNAVVAGQSQGKKPALVSLNPMSKTMSAPGAGHLEPAPVSDVGFVQTKNGRMPVMALDAKQRLDDDLIGTLAWNLRNRLAPSIGFNATPPREFAGSGKQWVYNPFSQQYERMSLNPAWNWWTGQGQQGKRDRLRR